MVYIKKLYIIHIILYNYEIYICIYSHYIRLHYFGIHVEKITRFSLGSAVESFVFYFLLEISEMGTRYNEKGFWRIKGIISGRFLIIAVFMYDWIEVVISLNFERFEFRLDFLRLITFDVVCVFIVLRYFRAFLRVLL